MLTSDRLPAIFRQYEGSVNYVQRKSAREFSSTCPACGGEIHSEPGKAGELPDRCIWFLDAKPLGFCRKCEKIFFPDASPDWTPPTAQQLEQWRRQQEGIQQKRKAAAERALAYLRSQKPWLQWHEAMEEHARHYWERRGLSKFWQDYWSLGWVSQREFFYRGQPFTSDAAAIPIFGPKWEPVNVKMRLQNFPSGAGKYRYHLSQGAAPLLLCDPDLDLSGRVIAVEGEIKALVLYSVLEDAKARVVGLPGTNPGPQIVEQLKPCDEITLVMDPKSEEQARRLAMKLSKQRCRILVTPVKVDDGILLANLGRKEVEALLRTAIPA